MFSNFTIKLTVTCDDTLFVASLTQHFHFIPAKGLFPLLSSLYCQSSLGNLCGQESLSDIRQDCCHHFVSEWGFGHDAQCVCQAERSLKSPLARTKQKCCVRLATNNLFIYHK